jgi:hypothetical protein
VAGSAGARLGAGIDVSAVQIFKNNVEAVDVYLPIFMILVRCPQRRPQCISINSGVPRSV